MLPLCSLASLKLIAALYEIPLMLEIILFIHFFFFSVSPSELTERHPLLEMLLACEQGAEKCMHEVQIK